MPSFIPQVLAKSMLLRSDNKNMVYGALTGMIRTHSLFLVLKLTQIMQDLILS